MTIERTSDHSARGSPRRSRGRLHPVHVAVRAFGEELLEPRLGVRRGIGPRDADGVEAVLARGFDQRGFDGGGIVQKSRLA